MKKIKLSVKRIYVKFPKAFSICFGQNSISKILYIHTQSDSSKIEYIYQDKHIHLFQGRGGGGDSCNFEDFKREVYLNEESYFQQFMLLNLCKYNNNNNNNKRISPPIVQINPD